jgi:hypothetical protein
VALAGAGLGLMLGTASTDAVNRAPRASYSEVTGITQTARMAASFLVAVRWLPRGRVETPAEVEVATAGATPSG